MRKHLHCYSHTPVLILGCGSPSVTILEKGRVFSQWPRKLNTFTDGRRKKIVAMSTNSNSTIRDNIANVFGAKRVQNLMGFDINLEEDNNKMIRQITQTETRATSIKGFISKPSTASHQTIDRQLFYVNSRPCNLPQISKTFNEIYKIFNLNSSPFIFANLLINSECYETRRLPGKTTAHLHDEQGLLESLKFSLSQFLKVQPFSFPQNSSASQIPTLEQQLSRERTNKTTHDDRFKNAESHEGNSSTHHYNNDFLEASDSIAQNAAKDSKLDMESDVSTSPSGDSDQEQIEKPFSMEIAFGQHTQLTHTTKKPASVEPGCYSRNNKRPKLEITGSNSTLTAHTTKLALNSQIKPAEPGIINKVQHDQNSSTDARGMKNSWAKIDHIDTEKNCISTNIAPDGVDRELDKPRSPQRSERVQTQFKIKDKKTGFIFAKNHNDIMQLRNQSQKNIRRHHKTANNVSESGQFNSQVDKDLELEQPHDRAPSDIVRSEDMAADEREYQAYQNSKVSSLIAEAEESKAISSKALRSRAISTLNNVQRSEIIKPVRLLTFSLTLSETYMKKLESVLNNDQGTARNDDKEVDEKTDLMSLSKSEFVNMRVIGQFNFGFVLAATKVQAKATSAPDLFIVDQHASDEKYNFENFESTLSITSQPLAHPQRIELTAVEEELISRHSDVLLKNGFKVALGNAGITGNDSQQRLVGLPSLGGVLYDKSDFQDLLNILNESNSANVGHRFSLPRPAKTRKILAMKACRSSIMIGKSLSRGQMKQIIFQLGQIDKPWHCPHGRPTIKYLSSLSKCHQWKEGDGVIGMAADGRHTARTDWAAYLR